MEKGSDGKIHIIPMGFQPICSKEMPYELTVSFLLTPDRPGFPQPIKLQEQHKLLFPLDRQINEESGKRVSEWAAGGTKSEIPPPPSSELDYGGYLKKVMGAKSFLGETKYYEILTSFGAKHADEIKTLKGVKDAYKMMVDEFHKIEKEKEQPK